MNYPLKNSQNGPFSNSRARSRYRRPLQIVIACIVVLFAIRLIVPGAIDSFFSLVFSPLWRMENAASADDFFATHTALVTENARLQGELDALAPVQSSVALLEQENAELKSLLGRSLPDLTLAAVLQTPPLSAYDNLIIDIGSNNHVKVGDRVYALASPLNSSSTENTAESATSTASTSTVSATPSVNSAEVLVPIGTVAESDPDSSKVSLFSSPGQKYSVEIGPDHIPAEATAQGGGMFDVEMAQGANVSVGDPVTVPDIETLSFGSVGSIVNDPARPYVSVLFADPVNPYQLRWVLVAKSQ